jgi:hypothetical protein
MEGLMMSRSTYRFAAWLPASGVVLALALGVTACGDSNDDSDQGNANASQETQVSPTGEGSDADRDAAAALMPRLRRLYNTMNGKDFCSNLTAPGRREVREFGLAIPELKADTCEETITGYSTRLVSAGGRHTPVRIKKLEVNGDKGSVTLNGGLAGIRSTATYKLAKDDGTWKLEDPISGAKTRTLPKGYR